MARSGANFRVEYAGKALIDRNQLNVDPVAANANAVREALSGMSVAQALLVGALPGQTVVIRYPRLPDMPEDQLDSAIENEAGQNIPYDLSEVFLDWVPLETIEDGNDKQLRILLVAAKTEVIESRVQIAEASEVQFGVLSVDSLSLADAAEAAGMLKAGETLALVNVGASSASIHFMRDGVSNFIRDVSWGAREMIQAVAKGRRVDYEEAQRMLAEADASGQLAAKPAAPEPPVESGGPGESLLDPLEEEPATSIGSGMGLSEYGSEEMDLRDILSTPISRLVSEIRRSFDYYEHQLYEKPVDRIVLSGGVANLSILKDTLMEELGVDSVDIADPAQGRVMVGNDYAVETLRDDPAQFMVAIGLAARGMADI